MTNESKEGEASETKILTRGYSVLSPVADKDDVGTWRRTDGDGLELSVMGSGGHLEHIEEEIFLENLKVLFSHILYENDKQEKHICSCGVILYQLSC